MDTLVGPARTNDAANVVLECPKCLKSCSTTDEECADCGFRFKPKPKPPSVLDHTIHFDPVLKRRYTTSIATQPGTAAKTSHLTFGTVAGVVLGVSFVTLGILMMYAMPFGFECGTIFVLFGGILIAGGFLMFEREYKGLEGCCPNCGEVCKVTIEKNKNSGAQRCEKCREVFFYDRGRFTDKR